MRRLLAAIGSVLLLLGVVAALFLWRASAAQRHAACVAVGICSDPAEVLATTLLSVQREQQLVVFSARLLTALTAVDERSVLGVRVGTARKTLLVPATMRYALDLHALRPADLLWDAGRRTLTVRRPALHILGPEIELDRAREFVDGRLMLALTGSERELDRINREQARARLLAEARQPELLRLAEDAADAALGRTFALPLAAAGWTDVRVEVARPR
jgi:hypothetical protein